LTDEIVVITEVEKRVIDIKGMGKLSDSTTQRESYKR